MVRLADQAPGRRAVVAIVTLVLLLTFAFLSNSRAAARDELASTNQQLTDAQAERDDLRAQVEEAQQRIEALEGDVGDAQSAAERRAEQLIERERKKLQQRLRKRAQQLDERSARLDARKRKLSQRASSLDERSRQLDQRAAEIAASDGHSASGSVAAAPETAGSNCHPSYTGACVPVTSDVDCAGGSGNGPAYVGTVTVVGHDEYGLDADGDGIGCE